MKKAISIMLISALLTAFLAVPLFADDNVSEQEQAVAAGEYLCGEDAQYDVFESFESQEALVGASLREQVVSYAVSWVGKVGYTLGSRQDLANGSRTDCSGFVSLVLLHFGLVNSRYYTTANYGGCTIPGTYVVSSADKQPGDIQFWDMGGGARHVAFYIGDGKSCGCNGRSATTGQVEITGEFSTCGRAPDKYIRLTAYGNETVSASAATAAASAAAASSLPVATNETGTDMYRLYNPNTGEHFYTSNTSERNQLVSYGWKYEGIGWTSPYGSNYPVYRMYNPYSGDHHYTMDASERDHLRSIGWNYEGVGWYSEPANSKPLYREFNPNETVGTHNYTTSASEHAYLVSIGWRDEGIAWYGVVG